MTTRIWVPAGLSRRKELATLAYVVIDELESSLVGLTVSPWPTLDDRGRLHFDLERAREVGATKRALETHLAKHRSPRKVAGRPLRMGDTFACGIKEPLKDGELLEPGDWMVPPISDISAEAREAAKLAFFSAAAPLVDRHADPEVVALAPKSTPLRSTRVASKPDPFRRRT
jgi:hypothetical protein